MVRKVAENREERQIARDAIKELAHDYEEGYGSAFMRARSVIGDPHGDVDLIFDLSDKQARIDTEHSEVRVSDLREVWQEHGFSESDTVYTARFVRDYQKDFVHEPDTRQVLRVMLFYEYPEQ